MSANEIIIGGRVQHTNGNVYVVESTREVGGRTVVVGRQIMEDGTRTGRRVLSADKLTALEATEVFGSDQTDYCSLSHAEYVDLVASDDVPPTDPGPDGCDDAALSAHDERLDSPTGWDAIEADADPAPVGSVATTAPDDSQVAPRDWPSALSGLFSGAMTEEIDGTFRVTIRRSGRISDRRWFDDRQSAESFALSANPPGGEIITIQPDPAPVNPTEPTTPTAPDDYPSPLTRAALVSLRSAVMDAIQTAEPGSGRWRVLCRSLDELSCDLNAFGLAGPGRSADGTPKRIRRRRRADRRSHTLPRSLFRARPHARRNGLAKLATLGFGPASVN